MTCHTMPYLQRAVQGAVTCAQLLWQLHGHHQIWDGGRLTPRDIAFFTLSLCGRRGREDVHCHPLQEPQLACQGVPVGVLRWRTHFVSTALHHTFFSCSHDSSGP